MKITPLLLNLKTGKENNEGDNPYRNKAEQNRSKGDILLSSDLFPP